MFGLSTYDHIKDIFPPAWSYAWPRVNHWNSLMHRTMWCDFIRCYKKNWEEARNASYAALEAGRISSKAWSGIIKPTLSVSSETREKHIWQRRREKGEETERKDEMDRKEKKEKGGERRKQQRLTGGVVMRTSLMLAICSVGIFQTEAWLDPQGETEASHCPSFPLFLFPCEEFTDFQMQYSAGGLQKHSKHHTGLSLLFAGVLTVSIFTCISISSYFWASVCGVCI